MEIPHLIHNEAALRDSRSLRHDLGRASLLQSGSQLIRGGIEMNLDGETKIQRVYTLTREELGDLENEATENDKVIIRVDQATPIDEITVYSELINSGEAICLIPAANTGSKLLNATAAAQKAMEAGVQPHRLLFEDDNDGQSDIAENLRSILS